MAVSSTKLRTGVYEALSLTSSSSSRSRSPPQPVFVTAPQAHRRSFRNIRHISAGLGLGASLRFSPKLAHMSNTATKKSGPGSAEEYYYVKKAVPPHCSCEQDLPLGDVSGSVSRGPARGLLASLTVPSILGEGGGQGRGEGRVGGLKEWLLLGCAFVTPDVGAASSASAGGVWWSQYAPGPAMHNLVAAALTLAGALGFLQIFNELAKRDVLDKDEEVKESLRRHLTTENFARIGMPNGCSALELATTDSKLSRKLVHIGVGLGFMLFWPLFTTSPLSRYLAAFAPAANGVRMLAIGSGVMKNDAVVKAMSRKGDPRELLRGPLYYALAVVVTTVGFWRTSPVGIVALVNLCAGDGFADIIGRNAGKIKLPYNKDKSVAGTMGCFVMSSLISILYLWYFSTFGLLEILPGTFVGVILVSFLTALVESHPLSTRLDDNFTVPFAATAFGMLILPKN